VWSGEEQIHQGEGKRISIMSMEKRKHTRIPIHFTAALVFSDDDRHQGSTENMSFGGAYIKCKPLANTPRRDRCLFELILSSPPAELKIPIKCRLIRADDHGVGVQFLSIDIRDYEEFKKLMVFNSPSPEKLLAELEQEPGLAVVG
jgi:hypothetical protein